MKNWLGLGLALALACGGGEEPTEEDSSGGEEMHHAEGDHEHGEEQHDDHGEMPPALSAFHEAFAAHWHGDRSAEAVCPTIENLKSLSDAAAAEHSQHPDEGAELNASAEAAVASCASGEGWDAAFDRWHNALHGVMHVPVPH